MHSTKRLQMVFIMVLLCMPMISSAATSETVPLNVDIVGPKAATAGMPTTWTINQSSTQPTVQPTYKITWGDGTDTTVKTASTLTHTYNDAGTYTIRLDITDQAGGTGSDTAVVTITAAQKAPHITSASLSVPNSLCFALTDRHGSIIPCF